MILDRLRRVGGPDAGKRDHAPLRPGEPGTRPHLAEQEVALHLLERAGHPGRLDDHDFSVNLLRPRVAHVIPSAESADRISQLSLMLRRLTFRCPGASIQLWLP